MIPAIAFTDQETSPFFFLFDAGILHALSPCAHRLVGVCHVQTKRRNAAQRVSAAEGEPTNKFLPTHSSLHLWHSYATFRDIITGGMFSPTGPANTDSLVGESGLGVGNLGLGRGQVGRAQPVKRPVSFHSYHDPLINIVLLAQLLPTFSQQERAHRLPICNRSILFALPLRSSLEPPSP